MSNIPAKDGNDSLVDLATHLIGGEHHGAFLPSDPGTGAPFKAADDATLAALNVIAAAVQAAVEAINGKMPASPATETTLATIAGAVGAHDTAAVAGRPGMVMLVRRRDEDGELTVEDGDFTFLNMNEEGRLKVATKPALYPDITGNITAVQATIGTPVAGGTVSGNVERASNVMAFCTGTFSTVNCSFEGSLEPTGDANWFGIQAVRSNANTVEASTGNLSAQPVYAWEMSVNGLARVRVRCTARTSGTQSWRFKLGSYATEPIPAAQITGNQPITHAGALAAGTARVGFVAGAGIWYDDTSTLLAANATFTGTARDATVTATATAFANAGTYAMEVRVSAETDQAGTLWLETSRDNATWRRVKAVPTAAVTGGAQAAEIVHRPAWRYWRAGFTNGATLQTRLTVGSIAIAA
jgi:hypothetical protein